MNNKKPMRSLYWWIVLLLCIGFFIKTVVQIFQSGFASVMNSESGLGVVVPALFFIAWFTVPKLSFLQPEDRSVPSPAENTPLSAPAVLTIDRKNSPISALVPITVSLNGAPVCVLKNGESARVTLTMRHNVLLTNAVGSPKVRCEFDAPDGGVGSVTLRAGEFNQKSLQWNS